MNECEQNDPRICRVCRAISSLTGEMPDCGELGAQKQRNGLLGALFKHKRAKDMQCGTCRYMKLQMNGSRVYLQNDQNVNTPAAPTPPRQHNATR